MQALYLSTLMRHKYFIPSGWSSSGRSPVGSLFIREEHKTVGLCCATLAGLAQNDIGVHCQTQNGQDHSCFSNLQLLKVNKPSCKLNEKLNRCECLFHSIPTEKTCEASLLGVPFHRNQTTVLSVQTRDGPVALAN